MKKLFWTDVISDYLSMYDPDFTRLRWFIRRLTQIEHPVGVNIFLKELSNLLPCMSEIFRYFLAVSHITDQDWGIIGCELLDIFTNEIVMSNEYYQLSILSLFSAQKKLDNLQKILKLYKIATPNLRREIILCAAKQGAGDWLRELKLEFPSMDPWNRRAYLYAMSLLPSEEKKFFLNHIDSEDIEEELIIKWSKSKKR